MNPATFEIDIQRAAKSLNSGGVALVPTDTVYGLAAVPSMKAAVERIFLLKGRPQSVNLPIMASSVAELERLGLDLNYSARKLLSSPLVPGAVTIAVGLRREYVADWLKGRDEVAFRIPKDDRLLEILRRVGPLLVTSANAHGRSSGEDVPEILSQLSGEPDVIIDGGSLPRVPSTLVNCRMSPPLIERVGVVSASEIEKHLSDG